MHCSDLQPLLHVFIPTRLTKELEAAKLKHQLALERHEGELADMHLGKRFFMLKMVIQ